MKTQFKLLKALLLWLWLTEMSLFLSQIESIIEPFYFLPHIKNHVTFLCSSINIQVLSWLRYLYNIDVSGNQCWQIVNKQLGSWEVDIVRNILAMETNSSMISSYL